MKNRSLEASQKRMTIITYTALIIGALIMIFPFVWMILTSLKTVPESMKVPPTIFPEEVVIGNFGDAMKSLPFLKLYLNTGLMIFFRVICAVAFSSMAGYAFAMLEFRGKKLLFGIVLVQMSLPSQIFIIPQYQMVAKMGLANTIFALVFPGIVSAFGVFFLRQTYMGIPKEIGEAAFLDDPLLRPGHPARPVHHQLPRADGRFPAGNAAHGRSLSDLPAPVYRGHRLHRR